MIVDLAKIREYVDKGLVSEQKHPTGDLYIFNYTHSCQFEGAWDEVTKMCRGLITDGTGKVVARPFNKFFNRGEQGEPHTGLFTAYDKLDGSLGIMYPLDGKLYIATRGSFTSDQAIKANELLEKMTSVKVVKEALVKITKDFTLMFEIIYPENRIVVDYGGFEGLIYLASREIETGRVTTEHEIWFSHTKEVKDFEKPRDNAEGVVLYYTDGFMEKVKYEEYVRLHRIVTGVTARRIWDLLRNNQFEDFVEMTTKVPEEFEKWAKDTAQMLIMMYGKVESEAKKALDIIKALPSRKDQAVAIMKNYPKSSGIIFKMLDDQSYEQIIWKMLKPPAEKPFREDM